MLGPQFQNWCRAYVGYGCVGAERAGDEISRMFEVYSGGGPW